MGAYAISLILMSVVGLGLYLHGLVRLGRERKAERRVETAPIKSRAADA